MKYLKLILTVFVLAIFTNMHGQKTQKQIDREKNNVDVFSPEERANLQLHFYDKTKEMNLSEEVEEEYYRLVLHYVYDIQRLDDRDKDYTSEELKIEMDKITSIMNSKIKPVLNEEQYKAHINNFNDILKSVYRKNGWKWNKE